jgi:hypothetical protein
MWRQNLPRPYIRSIEISCTINLDIFVTYFEKKNIIMIIITFRIYITRINVNTTTIHRKNILSNTVTDIFYRADRFEI